MAATTVDKLLIRIESDMGDIRRDLQRLEKQTSQSTGRMQTAFAGLSRFLGPAIGVAFAVQLGKASMRLVKFASDIEEMTAMSEAVFGEFIGQVRAELEEFGNAVGRSSIDLEQMAASVQDTFVPLGFARGVAADLSVTLTKLAVDVGSFKNELAPNVMMAFQSALVGNHEAVRRFGIVITEAELKQELFRMGITKNINQVTAQEKVMARLNLLIAGTGDAQGDAAKTADSFANRSQALNAQLRALAADLGDELLPAAKEIVVVFTDATKQFREFLKTFGIGLSIDDEFIQAAQAEKEARLELEKLKNAYLKTLDAFGHTDEGTRKLSESLQNQAEVYRLAKIRSDELFDSTSFFAKLFPETTKAVDENTEATSGATVAADKLAKATQNIIDEGQILTAQIRGESEAFMEQLKVAQKLGISVNDLDEELKNLIVNNVQLKNKIDAATKSAEEQAEALNALQNSLTGMREKTIQARLANSGLTEVQKQVTQFILENKNATSEQIEEFQKLAQETFDLTQSNEVLIDSEDDLTNTLNKTGLTVKGLGEAVANVTRFLTDMAGSVGLSELDEEMQATLAFIERFPNATAAQIEEFQRLNETQNNVASTLNDNVSPAMQSALRFIEEMATDTDRLRLIELGLIEAFLEGIITLEQYEKAIEDLRIRTAEMLDKVGPLQEELAQSIKTMSASISSSLADMVIEGEFNLDSLENIFESFVKRMIAKALELFVINKIMNSAFSAMTGGGSLGLDVLPFPKFASGGAINGKASGGAIRSPVLVGERGPELFVPNSAGVIRNAHDTRGMMRGGGTVTINQTLNVETGVAQTVRSELANFAPILKQDTIRAVMEARRRGGQFANAFGG